MTDHDGKQIADAEPDLDPDDETAPGEMPDGEIPVAESRRARMTRYAKATKARTEVVRAHAVERVERLEADRERHPLADIVFSIRDDDDRIAGRELAAAVAYRLFFLMLPLVLVFVGGIGLTGASDRGAAEDAVRSSGASAAVAQSIADSTADLSILQHIVVLGIGVWGTYFAAGGLMKTLARVNAGAWQVPVVKPGRKLRALAIVVGLIVGLLLISHEWNQLRGKLGVLEFLFALPVVGVIYATMIVALHVQLPRPEGVPWTRLVPGGLMVGISIAALQALVLGYIAKRLSSSSELYGGIGTAIVLLFWLYILGRVLVVGPILDGVLWRRTRAAESS